MKESAELLAKHAAEYAIEVATQDQAIYIPKLLEKFAELIIQECITTLEFHGYAETIPYIKYMAINKLGVKA